MAPTSKTSRSMVLTKEVARKAADQPGTPERIARHLEYFAEAVLPIEDGRLHAVACWDEREWPPHPDGPFEICVKFDDGESDASYYGEFR